MQMNASIVQSLVKLLARRNRQTSVHFQVIDSGLHRSSPMNDPKPNLPLYERNILRAPRLHNPTPVFPPNALKPRTTRVSCRRRLERLKLVGTVQFKLLLWTWSLGTMWVLPITTSRLTLRKEGRIKVRLHALEATGACRVKTFLSMLV